MKQVLLGSSGVTPADVLAVARVNAQVVIDDSARAAVAAARAVIDELAAAPIPAYGVSTGFGALANRHISPELRAQLQRSLVRSHAAGMGPIVETEVVRALMFLRLKTLVSGRTGVRPLVIARKISGGTRSPKGSATRMGLASLFGTWIAQGLNPFTQCLALLTTKSPLG